MNVILDSQGKRRDKKMQNEYWKRFEETGFVSDYLDYVRIRGDWQGKINKEGAIQNESRNSDRNGVIRDANWGI